MRRLGISVLPRRFVGDLLDVTGDSVAAHRPRVAPMVLSMSSSSVPGTDSVFFASLTIDYLPVDKVRGKARGFDTPVKSRGRE
jgi:hypothetical protein